ncbi:MAG TPA: GyrI-like domain-containing protein [Gemmatimonadaceae bacterium]|jgi:AraC family transcriptional regulator
MDVVIRGFSDMRVAAIRHIGPYDQISEAFARLEPIATSGGLFNSPTAAMVALFYDDPKSTPPDKLRSDAGIVVPSDMKLPSGVTEQTIPGGEYATAVHTGPYAGLPAFWAQLTGEWLPTSGRRRAEGLSYEFYLNNPMQVPPAELRTEIRIPLTRG